MRAADVLELLAARGIRLSVQGDHLRAQPRDLLGESDRELIRSYKAVLLSHLRADADHEAVEERAAIMEFDGGMTRADAEAAARAGWESTVN